MSYCKGRQSGMTLLELLIGLGIVAILAAIAAPSFQSFSSNQQVRSANETLLSALSLARSQAVTRNSPVVVRALPVGDPNADWVNGWEISSGGDTLRVQERLNGVTIASGVSEITFNRDGRAGVAAFSVEAASAAGTDARCIGVGLSGAATSRKGAC